MKLIIDIPEEDIEFIKSRGYHTQSLYDAIKNGTPFDSVIEDIKAEIEKKHLSIIEKNDFDCGRTYGYEECLEIIDKHISGKEK